MTSFSYTKADNSVVVPTDTMKQTTYIIAKQHPVDPPELFAAILAAHFTDTYKHIHTAIVKVVTHRWSRMTVGGKPHPHSFMRDGAETRNAEATSTEGQGISIRSAIAGLLVLKSTGSGFNGFVQDEYTILQETQDRILSTEVDCGWSWNIFKSVDAVKGEVSKFGKTWESAREITLETFATDDSASVQNTMYKMCDKILNADSSVNAVDYSLPNKHYFEIGKFSSLFVMASANQHLNDRSKLAQGSEEYWEGRRGLCSANQSKRIDSMHRDSREMNTMTTFKCQLVISTEFSAPL